MCIRDSTGTLLIGFEDLLAFFGRITLLGLEGSVCPAVLAVVLGIATLVMSVLDDVWTATLTTVIGDGLLNHRVAPCEFRSARLSIPHHSDINHYPKPLSLALSPYQKTFPIKNAHYDQGQIVGCFIFVFQH